jgi:hypothetical protein
MASVTTNVSNDNSTTPLPVSQGGTGANSLASGRVLLGGGTSAISVVSAPGTANQVLRSTGSSAGFVDSFPIWSTTASTALTGAVDQSYVFSSALLVTLTLPTSFAVGQMIGIQGQGAGGWVMAAGTGRIIQFLGVATSSGGSLASTNQYDSCFVVGLIANSTWSVVFASTGGLTVL